MRIIGLGVPGSGAASGRLAGQVVNETHVLGEGTAVAVRAEAGREVGVECGSMVADYRGRKEGRRPDKPGELGQAPAMFGNELLVPSRLEPGVGQDLQIGPTLLRQVPARGNSVLGT